MSAIEMQSLLARLYVDEYCRQLFRHRPDLVLEGYTLTAAEEEALLGINADRLDLHALGLIGKREKHLRSYFRLLFTLNDLTDEREVARLFKRFYGLHPATAEISQDVEARLFGAFIAQSLQGNTRVPAYAAAIARYDLARYETAYASDIPPNGHADASEALGAITLDDVFSFNRRVRVAQFEYDVIDIAAQLQQGRLPANVGTKRTTVVLQYRDEKLKTFAINGPTAILLRTIDGHRTVRQGVDAVEASFGTTGLAGSITALVRRLEEERVLVRVPPNSERTRLKRVTHAVH